MEPRTANGRYDAAEDLYTLHTPTQGVAGFRARVGHFLHVLANNESKEVQP